ncbi:ribosomal-processing cysteine protease Prp [Cohnella nanjingensis]|uniref:Ribosomal processing cysteine protease Prp n=1 Tax=Cohnella nanjingensis TaxID=1387779 RepID=A0A7X0RXM6_9BACL|nr:ribosomal-processing cysteine protease Prp [Cohnella nanjingensis]MBB6674250.1 ribosomal-processing cysteine protease Prp [Cohnella nanjingensis]
MITITIYRDQDERIKRFSVTGHAKYDDPGKDIVCAGVSAVTVGAVNAIEKLTGIVPDAEMKSGFLSASMPESGETHRNEQLQLLLAGMVVALESIADQYGKHVRIKHTLA